MTDENAQSVHSSCVLSFITSSFPFDFNLLSSKTLSKTITIPFSYTDLADYLGIDRSAMMRDIKTLVDHRYY